MKTFLSVQLIMSFVVVVFQQSRCFADGECSAQFLKVGIGARACAMGEAYTSVADDPAALAYNPSGIGQIKKYDMLATQNFWLMDMQFQYVGLVIPTKLGVFGASGIFSHSGTIEKWENFEKIGEYKAFDLALGISYSKMLIKELYAGLTVKGIHQVIENEDAQAVAVDFGMLYTMPFVKNLKVGVAVNNIGKGIRFISEEDPLPLVIRAGASYEYKFFLVSADLTKPIDYNFTGKFGAEFNFKKMIFARIGYNTLASVTAGAGLSIFKFTVNYAFLHHRYLDSSHLIEVGFRL